MSRFIVMEKRTGSTWGTYIKVAVLEIESDFVGVPKMISERARGVIRIVESWGPRNLGHTERSAGFRARRDARELCRKLNCPLERIVLET